MTWARFDDEASESIKVRRAGTQAAALWWASVIWCSRHRTDGVIDRDLVADIWRPIGEAFDAEAAAARLVEVGLWDEHERGYAVHDFLDYNPTAAEVKRQAEAAAARQAKRRRASLERVERVAGVTSPDVTADVTRDVTRDSHGTYTVSHTTPSRPVPSRTPSGVRAPARVAPSGPIETGARLRARLEHVIREATGTGPILDHRRSQADAIVAKVDARTLGAEVEAYGAWLASCAPEKRPRDPWLRFCDHLGSWATMALQKAAQEVVIRVNPLATMGADDG